jgi:hypothetical protein
MYTKICKYTTNYRFEFCCCVSILTGSAIHCDLTPFFRCFLSVLSFDFTPEEVVNFCNDCVLSEDKDECDVPEAFAELERGSAPKP